MPEQSLRAIDLPDSFVLREFRPGVMYIPSGTGSGSHTFILTEDASTREHMTGPGVVPGFIHQLVKNHVPESPFVGLVMLDIEDFPLRPRPGQRVRDYLAELSEYRGFEALRESPARLVSLIGDFQFPLLE